MKILITGSRNIIDTHKIFTILAKEISKGDIIIHGGAKGVDSIAQTYCLMHSIKYELVPSLYPSKGEYYLYRDAEMVGMCDKVIAIWDGKSTGTKFTFNYAKKRGKEVKIFKYLAV